jgi:Cd2+/Zn2+-exporting ATPase
LPVSTVLAIAALAAALFAAIARPRLAPDWAVAALGALVLGEYAEGAAVVFLFALGNALEGYTMDRARRSIRALMSLAPATALVLRDGVERERPVGEVMAGEVIVVRSSPDRSTRT